MDCSTPGLLVHHQLPESTQTHVPWVSDGIQPSHPLSSPSLPDLNLSQHQCLFKWVSSLHQVAKVLEFQLQHQSFQWTSPLGWTGWISLQSKDSQESSPTPQFKSINSSALNFLYSPALTSIHDYQKCPIVSFKTWFVKIIKCNYHNHILMFWQTKIHIIIYIFIT